jgi:hypothetical protein
MGSPSKTRLRGRRANQRMSQTFAKVEEKALWKYSPEWGKEYGFDEKDLVFKQKSVGKYKIELIGGKDRGAVITIWMPMNLYGIDWSKFNGTHSRDDKMDNTAEIHFMHCNNALEEYHYLKTVDDLFDIIRRNG